MVWIWWCLKEDTVLWQFAKEHFLKSLLQKNSRSEKAHVFFEFLSGSNLKLRHEQCQTIPGVFIPHQTWRWIFWGVSKGKMWVPFGRIPKLCVPPRTYYIFLMLGQLWGMFTKELLGSPRVPTSSLSRVDSSFQNLVSPVWFYSLNLWIFWYQHVVICM